MEGFIDYLGEHYLLLVLTSGYMALVLYIGWYFRKKAASGTQAFYIAKREIPGWVVSLAFFSTFTSTNTYIGQAGQAFKYGLSWAWVGLFWAIFCIISWLLLGPRMRNQTAKLGSCTIPDYFHFRYKSNISRLVRLFSAIVILFATLWYMVGIVKGTSHVFESVFGLPYAWGAAIIIAVTCAYTVWGGMYSVLWTDAIQGIMMFAVAILMVMIPIVYIGGAGELLEAIGNTAHPDVEGRPIGNGLVTFGQLTSFMYILGIGLAVGMKQIAEPRCLVRFYSIDNTKSMKFAMIWTPVFLGISLICVMGLGALVHGMASEEEASYLIKNTDEVVGFMLAKFNHPLVSGICVAGLFAAGMSSLASVMLIVGTAFVNDVLEVTVKVRQGKNILFTRWTIVLYSVIVFLFTLAPPANIVELTAFSGAIFAASFFPAIFGGLYLKWGTDLGALTSMISGMVAAIVWRFVFRLEYAALKDIHEIIPAFIFSLLVYIVVSLATKGRMPDKEHLEHLFS